MTTELPDSSSSSPAIAVGETDVDVSLVDDAVLSVMGLLEASDRAAFDRAYEAADPATQAAIREIEAAWATEPALRSRETPDPALRMRVIDAVRREMASRSQPVGSSSEVALEDLRGPLQGLVEQIRAQQESTRRVRTAPWLWRAASLTLAAGLLVSAWFQVRLSERVAMIAELAMQRQTDDQLRTLIGPGFDRFLAARTRVVGLSGTSAAVDGAATIYLDPEAGDGFLLALGLSPQAGPYTLRIVEEQASRTLLSFDPRDAAAGFRISAERLAGVVGGRFEIVDGAGTVMLRSA